MWSEEPILDSDTVTRLVRLGGPGFVHELVRMFNDHGAERVAAIRAAAEAADLNGVRRGAHSLVSTAGNLGARRLEQLAVSLERAAATLDTGTVTALVPSLVPAYDAVRDELARRTTEIAA